ncbi:hypothetical protein KFD70_21845 [Bacillus pfraonensis]|uniref:hypothetical protein n=1 Tax=Bacillus pfraonensis TaxID=2830844 RepID=UPI003D6DEFA1
MKKRLSLILASALAIGSLTACGDTDKTTKPEAKQVSSDVQKENKSKENSTPTNRTVDLKSEKYPWRFASRDIIKGWQDKGETVYLWSDANALEEYIASEVTRDNKHKQEDLPRSAGYVQLFIDEVKKDVPDKKEYFDKLSEVVTDMQSVNTDGAKVKIEEAKKLREAK